MKSNPKPKALWAQLAEKGHGRIPNGGLKVKKEKKRVRPITKKLAVSRREYLKIRKEFLSKNRICAIFDWKLSKEIHHSRGKTGPLLTDERFFIPVSRDGHDWIDRNRNLARRTTWKDRPVLCAVGDWNRPA